MCTFETKAVRTKLRESPVDFAIEVRHVVEFLLCEPACLDHPLQRVGPSRSALMNAWTGCSAPFRRLENLKRRNGLFLKIDELQNAGCR